jgi:hypothetical protein
MIRADLLIDRAGPLEPDGPVPAIPEGEQYRQRIGALDPNRSSGS